jgi:serine/threonine protein kinase
VKYNDGNASLGTGAFGKVVEATGTEMLRVPGKATKEPRELRLAVKILKEQNPKTDDQRLFMREIEAGCRAQHPTLLGFVSFSIFPYAVAMERGVISLRKALELEEAGRPFTYVNTDGENVRWDDTKRAIAAFGIAVAMCYLHEHGIIHRDLKTDNIMLDENLWPRVGDFGLSKILGSGDEAVNQAITQTMNVGTGCYMAPELFSEVGDGRYTSAIDVYAYAMVLYELITLAVPWSRPKGVTSVTKFQLIHYVSGGLRPTIPSTVPDSYRQLIEACWQQNPSLRPSFRQIVEQARGQSLCMTICDVNEVLDYQEEMMRTLDESRPKP